MVGSVRAGVVRRFFFLEQGGKSRVITLLCGMENIRERETRAQRRHCRQDWVMMEILQLLFLDFQVVLELCNLIFWIK